MTKRREPVPVEVLNGGVANAGEVVRIGDHVLRPANQHSKTTHRLLRHIRQHGFTGASVPVAIEEDRERLLFVAGDVPLPPYPSWAQSDDALVSTVRLIRGLHNASVGFVSRTTDWSDELRDANPGDDPVICHNDVCMENVVFRNGAAVTLLDFDFAAPGRREYDLAAFARMCVPIDDDLSAERLGWVAADRPARLGLVADAYDLDTRGRAELLTCLDESIARGGAFVKRHVDAGEPGFIEMWDAMGGMARFDRRREWWAAERHRFATAIV